MRKFLPLLCLGLLPSAAFAADGDQAATPTETWRPPVLTTERYNEDWSDLADPTAQTGHWTEPFKYIPLGSSDNNYLTTGIELRLRSEAYKDNWSNEAAPNDGYLWLRAMPYADLHVGQVRAFVQPIIAYAVGVQPEAGPVDQTRADVLQAFADVAFDLNDETTLRLRAGREMVGLGTERLIGTRYGPNVPLAFDGARAILHRKALTVNAFYLRPVEPGTGSFDDRTSSNRALWGVYVTQLIGGAGIDAYYLGYRNDDATFEQGNGREVRHSLGMRAFGKADGWHWNVEGVYQFGQFDTTAGHGAISAWTLATEVGRGFADLPLKPDFTLRFNMASGDKSADDKRLGTFNALFPKGKYFGELSPIGPYNIVNLQPVVAVDLGGGVSTSFAGAAYWRQSTGDGIYSIPGHLLRASGGSQARFVGKEAEAAIEWRATQELTLEASFSLFKAGRFLKDTGAADTIRMTGLEANFRF